MDPLRAITTLCRRGTPVDGEPDELLHLDLEPRDEGEPERPLLVQEGRHRDVPAAAHVADHVLERHLGGAQEDLAELGLARDLPERPNPTPGARMSTITYVSPA